MSSPKPPPGRAFPSPVRAAIRVERESPERAQICENGHVITTRSIGHPDRRQAFCDRCGAATLDACPACAKPIRGKSSQYYQEWRQPSYCPECGSAYPWTEQRLTAGRAIIDSAANLTEEERGELKGGLQDVVRDSPRTQVAVLTIRAFLGKVAPEVASGLKQILVEVASEAAKKQLGL